MIFNENNSKLFVSQPIQIIFHSSHFWSWRFLFFLLILEIRPIELSYGCFRTSIFRLASTLYFSYSFFLYFILPFHLFYFIIYQKHHFYLLWFSKGGCLSNTKHLLRKISWSLKSQTISMESVTLQQLLDRDETSKNIRHVAYLQAPLASWNSWWLWIILLLETNSIGHCQPYDPRLEMGIWNLNPPFYPLIVLFIVSYTYQCLIKMISLDA